MPPTRPVGAGPPVSTKFGMRSVKKVSPSLSANVVRPKVVKPKPLTASSFVEAGVVAEAELEGDAVGVVERELEQRGLDQHLGLLDVDLLDDALELARTGAGSRRSGGCCSRCRRRRRASPRSSARGRAPGCRRRGRAARAWAGRSARPRRLAPRPKKVDCSIRDCRTSAVSWASRFFSWITCTQVLGRNTAMSSLLDDLLDLRRCRPAWRRRSAGSCGSR